MLTFSIAHVDKYYFWYSDARRIDGISDVSTLHSCLALNWFFLPYNSNFKNYFSYFYPRNKLDFLFILDQKPTIHKA